MMRKTTAISAFLIIGILILGIAIFANKLELDPNPGWGRGRIALFLLGLLVALKPWITRKQSTVLDKTTDNDLFAFPVLLVVIGIYLWSVSISHELTSHYYSSLATSFRKGELSLPLRPDPALLQLPDPYDPAARQGIKVPVDVSLYNGKFYLYWGPAPSLLLAVVQPLLPGKISEVHLLFVFMCGIFLSQYVLILHLWEQFFPNLPRWILVVSIFLAGFANPALWLLSQPKIYEAAVAGAQSFFVGGLVSAVLALDRQPPSSWKLALAGILWSLAVGTRVVMVFPVIFMALMVIYWFLRIHSKSLVKLAFGLIPLGLPLFIGVAGFGWYNWARFGSILETGFTYQLAAPYLQKHLDELFSLAYIFQNLYNYLLNPLSIEQSFPFLYPVRGIITEIFSWPALPELYTAQAITGFLYTTPFTVFAIIPAARVLKKLFRKNQTDDSNEDLKTASLNWITTSLIGSFMLPFASLLAFFWAAMRYAEDFMPALILLSILGFWQGYELLSQSPKKGKIYVILGAVFAGISIVNAALLALSIYSSRG